MGQQSGHTLGLTKEWPEAVYRASIRLAAALRAEAASGHPGAEFGQHGVYSVQKSYTQGTSTQAHRLGITTPFQKSGSQGPERSFRKSPVSPLGELRPSVLPTLCSQAQGSLSQLLLLPQGPAAAVFPQEMGETGSRRSWATPRAPSSALPSPRYAPLTDLSQTGTLSWGPLPPKVQAMALKLSTAPTLKACH